MYVLMWFCICFFYIRSRFFALLLCSFITASRSLAKVKDDSVIYIFEMSLVLESFSLFVETLKVSSKQGVKSLSEIPPINSTLHTDLYHLIFELNVTVSLVKPRLGALTMWLLHCFFAGFLTKRSFPLSSNSFQIPQKPYKTTCLLSMVHPALQFESR